MGFNKFYQNQHKNNYELWTMNYELFITFAAQNKQAKTNEENLFCSNDTVTGSGNDGAFRNAGSQEAETDKGGNR
jgi:hypothetical protein